ncbi:hypothetical protein D3C84_650540 [compost metagenome]
MVAHGANVNFDQDGNYVIVMDAMFLSAMSVLPRVNSTPLFADQLSFNLYSERL